MNKMPLFLVVPVVIAMLFHASSATVSIVPMKQANWTVNGNYPDQQFTVYALNVTNTGPNAVCYVKFRLCLFCPEYNFENIDRIYNFDASTVANTYTLGNFTNIGAGKSSSNYVLITQGGTVQRGSQPPQIQAICSSGCPPVPCN